MMASIQELQNRKNELVQKHDKLLQKKRTIELKLNRINNEYTDVSQQLAALIHRELQQKEEQHAPESSSN